MIDVTVYSIHVNSDQNCYFRFQNDNNYYCKWVDVRTAKKACMEKQKYHPQYLRENHIITSAFDSERNIAPGIWDS